MTLPIQQDRGASVDGPRCAQGDTFSFDDFVKQATWFHNYPAPGLLLGGFMVEEAKRYIPEGVLYDAIAETSWCLPDAIQLLTPCTIGNGWLRILDLGVYALSLFDKHSGEGIRVAIDPSKFGQWGEIAVWHMKSKPKREQDSELLRQQIREAGATICSVKPVRVKPEHVAKRSKGGIAICGLCGEAYPSRFGAICRRCQGASPYVEGRLPQDAEAIIKSVMPRPIPVQESVGKKALHDMTRIVPGESKGPEFSRGQVLSAGDVCRLQQMGRFHVYVEEQAPEGFVHEDDVARQLGAAMAGPGVVIEGPPKEGKVNLVAERDGLLMVNRELLESINLLPRLVAASRRGYSQVRSGRRVAATRAVPLFLEEAVLSQALSLLEGDSLFEVKPMRKAKVGILITGNEVFEQLIEDRFEGVITAKVANFGCEVVKAVVAPDDSEAIAREARGLEELGCDLIVTTAGLSVDPDDVTRKGLMLAGLRDYLYSMPVLPGAMTLVGRLGSAQVLGVPACALFHKTTSLDVLLPRLLADVEINRQELARLGNGGLCRECAVCSFPKCGFGR